jgi:hypothetical protein
VEDITYGWSKNLTDNYGLLADIMGVNEHMIAQNLALLTNLVRNIVG